jgi:CHRD domain-containing protein
MNTSRRRGTRFALTAVAFLFFVATYAAADPPGKQKHFHARLDGGQETPAISTAGTGEFTATLNEAGTELSYELKFSGLSSNAVASHVHLGQFGVPGGVVFFLCGGGSKPACPASGGTVTGTVIASDVLALPSQGIVAGDFDKVITAMRQGLTYANVHTTNFPAGEIRGQINGERGR